MAEGDEIGGGFASAEAIEQATKNMKEYRAELRAAAGDAEKIKEVEEVKEDGKEVKDNLLQK